PRPDTFRGPDGAARRRAWDEQHDWQLLRNDAAFPRAWLVHEARVLRPIVGMDPADRLGPMTEILHPGDELWDQPGQAVFDPRRVAWIETGDPDELQRSLPRT